MLFRSRGIGAGTWDPTLLFVMAGAVAASAPGFLLAGRLKQPLLGGKSEVPAGRDVEGALIAGALIFGAGWGLVGYCPGPAIAGLIFARPETLIFIGAMVGGMIAYRLYGGLSASRTSR